ncbi:MAG: ABC transporter ATP-binding protein, partial [Tissierellia bacterium]|nr:ABC transporter ATP-binding protein [Tissierellia bacterium]
MIEIKNLSFKYKGAKEMSLRDINLNISSGECILLMGESGCGKTSITRLINGLIPEFYDGELSGEIYLDNKDLSKLYISQIAENVGSVFQDPRGQFFSTDTNSELAFGLECQGISSEKIKTRVDQIILDLKLETLANRSIFELSGGEKQQIAIGSVYATKPKVILLDEPSANLDDKGIKRLAKVLKLLKSKKYTIVIAEHRINYLLDLIDRAIFMNKGKIESIYFPKDLINMSNEERKLKGFRILKAEQLERKSTHEVFGETLLKVRDLKFYYDKSRPILNNLNLSLRSGEVIGIAGNNGAGKSTLLKIICGLIKEKSGKIYFNNERLNPKARVKNAYYVMQDSDYQLFTDSVRNEFSIGDIDASDAEILKTLEELSLKEYIEKHPLSLSGGQKQRLCIAVAKLKASKLICLDEPTSGLDYRSMLKVNNLIEELRIDKKAILIVSHDKEFLYKV